MTNQERLALADRVQKKVQKMYPQYRFIRRREQIKKVLKDNSNT
jgi:hypothetical protein